jgi:hypothetical protein
MRSDAEKPMVLGACTIEQQTDPSKNIKRDVDVQK